MDGLSVLHSTSKNSTFIPCIRLRTRFRPALCFIHANGFGNLCVLYMSMVLINPFVLYISMVLEIPMFCTCQWFWKTPMICACVILIILVHTHTHTHTYKHTHTHTHNVWLTGRLVLCDTCCLMDADVWHVALHINATHTRTRTRTRTHTHTHCMH